MSTGFLTRQMPRQTRRPKARGIAQFLVDTILHFCGNASNGLNHHQPVGSATCTSRYIRPTVPVCYIIFNLVSNENSPCICQILHILPFISGFMFHLLSSLHLPSTLDRVQKHQILVLVPLASPYVALVDNIDFILLELASSATKWQT